MLAACDIITSRCRERDLRPGFRGARSRAQEPRSAVRRKVLHRRHIHAHLLPAGVPGAEPQAHQHPVLRDRCRGGRSRVPPLFAMSSRGGARHAGLARHVRRRQTRAQADRRRRARRGVGERTRRARRYRTAPPASAVRAARGCVAERRGANAAAALREAADRRDEPADDGHRAGGGLRQPAPVQQRVPGHVQARAARASAPARPRLGRRWRGDHASRSGRP